MWVYGTLAELDLNTLTGSKAGKYWQGASVNATVALHYPVGEAGSLDVEKNLANGPEGCVQRYTTYGLNNIPRMFVRSYNPAVPTWGEWQEMARSASPAFTGTPTAPTAAAGENSTQLATTAFVSTATANLSVSTANNLAKKIGHRRDCRYSTALAAG
ncbi:hypothetical protein OS42_39940 [Dickeya oryzae]